MQTYRTETTISKDGTISIKNLPFSEGDKVEIMVRNRKRENDKNKGKYTLRGLPINYLKPFDNVAEDDWAVLG